MIRALEEPAGAGGRQSGQRAPQAPRAPRRERRQPHSLCPPAAGSRAAPSPPTSGEGKQQRQRTIAIVFQDLLSGQSLQRGAAAQPLRLRHGRPAALGAVQTPVGTRPPVPRCLPPNHQSALPANTERDGAGVVTPRTTALLPLCSPPPPSTVGHPRDTQAHRQPSSRNPQQGKGNPSPRRKALGKEKKGAGCLREPGSPSPSPVPCSPRD